MLWQDFLLHENQTTEAPRTRSRPRTRRTTRLPVGSGGHAVLLAGEITDDVIGAAVDVHRELGPGLLESVYETCLCHELGLRGLAFRQQVHVPVKYKGMDLDAGCRIDILVEDEVVVEVKAVEKLLGVHEAQLLTYLRLAGKRVGLLLNFNVPRLKDGIVRRVL
jgi:GxxExxY protein